MAELLDRSDPQHNARRPGGGIRTPVPVRRARRAPRRTQPRYSETRAPPRRAGAGRRGSHYRRPGCSPDSLTPAGRPATSPGGGTWRLGSEPGGGFGFDNEKWAHPVPVAPFRIARAAVTNAEFAAFVTDGGYREAPSGRPKAPGGARNLTPRNRSPGRVTGRKAGPSGGSTGTSRWRPNSRSSTPTGTRRTPIVTGRAAVCPRRRSGRPPQPTGRHRTARSARPSAPIPRGGGTHARPRQPRWRPCRLRRRRRLPQGRQRLGLPADARQCLGMDGESVPALPRLGARRLQGVFGARLRDPQGSVRRRLGDPLADGRRRLSQLIRPGPPRRVRWLPHGGS